MTIYAYKRHVTRDVTRELRLPSDDGRPVGTVLAEVDGVTYIHVPDGFDLPAEQPDEIYKTVRVVDIDAGLRGAIAAASPHVALINARVAQMISERYDISDEIKLLRTAPSPEFELYNAFVEDCRAWGREQKSLIGL